MGMPLRASLLRPPLLVVESSLLHLTLVQIQRLFVAGAVSRGRMDGAVLVRAAGDVVRTAFDGRGAGCGGSCDARDVDHSACAARFLREAAEGFGCLGEEIDC
ncbi:hypothetical protein Nepgr_009067 [Nepenthes gracilis]|uniref:Uncharacterized protein n=1 Tax=Nepenthes gracilis TaxID=150966 RepID=A0AAD3XJT8_NEPGR|nr:hypothetical protein Nepgr_009067 [Nepenthes gracilis]